VLVNYQIARNVSLEYCYFWEQVKSQDGGSGL